MSESQQIIKVGNVDVANHSRVRCLSSIVRKIRGKNLVPFIHAFLMQLARQTNF